MDRADQLSISWEDIVSELHTDELDIDDLDVVIGPSGATDAVGGAPCLVAIWAIWISFK